MRATVDTNIWVSAVLSDKGAPAKLLQAYRAGRFTVVASLPLLEELEEVLMRPQIAGRLSIPHHSALAVPAYLRRRAELVEIDRSLKVCQDPKDDKVIETAVRGGVDYLVSNDLRHMQKNPALCEWLARLGIKVIVAHLFLMELDGE